MISIAEAISDLLFVRDTVVVPGLGAFVKKAVSAKAPGQIQQYRRASGMPCLPACWSLMPTCAKTMI